VLSDLVHEERHRIGDAGEIGLEPSVRTRVADVGLRPLVVIVRGSALAERRELDSPLLELAPQEREILLVEVQLGRLRLEGGYLEYAIALGVLDQVDEFLRFENGADLSLLLLSGRCDARSAPLEPLDATSLRDWAFDARVRGMTVRADLDGERGLHGSCDEFVPTGATAHMGRYEVRMVPLHVSNSSQVFSADGR
jgi:hypothetical protein